ncbi:hypothetical protein [Amycolatopsis sp. FDAARGOS 1241]|uniref:hypothetical protein n=1 Tax=Amycolatopsis sp. FDAARGOS 1241 TaxID=2778070 RepID=UPI001EF3C851|nr:hypothetical protein [Amycolatopsis sp. FDAARGOS 1241]
MPALRDLSHSFRFGDAVAAEANRRLAIADAPIHLTGSPTVESRLDTVEDPDAILCRTNGGATAEILTPPAARRRVALAGRADELRRPAEAARDLQAGRRTTHPPRAAAVCHLGRSAGLRRAGPRRARPAPVRRRDRRIRRRRRQPPVVAVRSRGARLPSGRICGETDREVHYVPSPALSPADDTMAALCGTALPHNGIELVDDVGVPCANCLLQFLHLRGPRPEPAGGALARVVRLGSPHRRGRYA